MYKLKNKNVLVTGGGSGIGCAIAQLFASRGACIHLLDINRKEGNNVREEIVKTGGDARFYPADVADHNQVILIVKKIARKAPIDILINSAGIAHIGNLEATTEQDMDRIYDVNVKGTYNCMYACVPYMKQQKKGLIINIVSIAASVGISDRFAYSMSKGACLTMTYSVAKDYIKDGIRCNSISPARIHTPFVDAFLSKNYPGQEKEMYKKLSETQPIGRMGKPEEVAALALYLASPEAAFITGTDFPIDGGFIKLNS